VVEITNDQTGHHVPTDSPLRHMILLVEVTNTDGNPLSLIEGETVPDWGGVGDPADGYYAGLPGKAYAKILQELWTEVTPTGAYWNPTRVLFDNRLAAFQTDRSVYLFALEGNGPFTVSVKLLFRRAFIQLADWKGWQDEDILMESETITLLHASSGSRPGANLDTASNISRPESTHSPISLSKWRWLDQ
jgi:hypothetical protein